MRSYRVVVTLIGIKRTYTVQCDNIIAAAHPVRFWPHVVVIRER